jgi:exopolysaccharide biosynthesis polyprenyl glycosylphosphotransferase
MIPRRIFWLLDTLVLMASFQAAYLLTPTVQPMARPLARVIGSAAPALIPYLEPRLGVLSPLSELVWILAVITPAVLIALESIHAYGGMRHMSPIRLFLAGPFAVGVGLSAAALVIFALRIHDWSRLFLLLFATLATVGLTGVRMVVWLYHSWQARAGYYTRNALAVGPEDRVPALVRFVAQHWPEREYRFIGYLEAARLRAVRLAAGARVGASDARPRADGEPAEQAAVRPAVHVDVGPDGAAITVPRFGTVQDVSQVLVRRPVHEVIAVLPADGGAWFGAVVDACDRAGVPLRMVPDLLLGSGPSNLRCVRDLPDRATPSILLAPRDLSAEALQVKRMMDVGVSAALLVLLSPLFALLAMLVRLSGPGPIFYRWHVVGQNGQDFVGYKFRTMVPNADALKPQLLASNEMGGAVFKMRHDPRITPIGRWLRKYSLDELPQLWNVLKGDMSLVGPRPAFPTELERYDFWHMRKLSIRPGITCLWQVRGRNQIADFDEWVRMDLEYIDTWSLWSDVTILCRTVFAVLRGTGH